MRLYNKLLFLLILPFYLYAKPFFWIEPSSNCMQDFENQLSIELVERILGRHVQKTKVTNSKILCMGSILHFAREGDSIWGSGLNSKYPWPKDELFWSLDIRSVRGPLTRLVLKSFGIEAPPIYGDPGLLFARFFPEFKKNPIRDHLLLIKSSENDQISKEENVAFSTDPWQSVVQKIVESKFVISTSLEGLVIAESYGIPARLLRLTQNESLFEVADYYLGSGRDGFQYARTIKQALQMRGEKPPICDLDQLLEVFPFELF